MFTAYDLISSNWGQKTKTIESNAKKLYKTMVYCTLNKSFHNDCHIYTYLYIHGISLNISVI